MGKINLLSYDVANLIAAGEVVDRPSSVVKELIENSIDAHASKITVEIKNGGISYIRVSDNGCGIEPEDMPLALKRHATSKISCAEDLNAIFTLGFRGEALAAISSVSKLRIISKTENSANGTMLYADSGNIVSVSEAGCPNGTTITVEELFYAVPARRKFLKKDSTEASAVCAVVEKAALAHPEVSIRLISDGNIKIDSIGDGKLENAIYSVLGRTFARSIIPIKSKSDGIDVYGYIGSPDNVRPTRNFQNFFINHRYVKSRTAMAALEQAFTSYIAPDRFPSCVLFINVNPAAVDVNVHPAKLEVRFSNEKLIFDAVYYSVRSALEKSTNRPDLVLCEPPATSFSTAFAPVIDFSEKRNYVPEQIKFSNIDITKYPSSNALDGKKIPVSIGSENVIADYPIENTVSFDGRKSTDITDENKFVPNIADFDMPDLPALPKINEVKEPVTTVNAVSDANIPEYKILGVAYNTYIFVETDNKVVVIDKHAAHERIIFEELRGRLSDFTPPPQILLVPIVLELSHNDFAAVCEYRDNFAEIGFAFDIDKASNRIKLLQIPSAFDTSNAASMFSVMADRLSSGTGNVEITKNDAYEKALYQVSCKAAMKGGRVDSESDISYVVEKILTIPDITVCPHGRPVVIYIKKHSLDRQFGRE